jgi:RimJ/RimL family protein N-acetyltransferase
MFATKGKIRFIRLKKEDIELVRHWRNHPSISRTMVYREHITKEMQEKWFESVNNNFNLYFIIEYKGKKIGLINGKDIKWEEKVMETGIFIWDKYYRKTHIPTICTMIFAELGVAIWGLKPTATILKDNERALKYNKMLGFKIFEDDPAKNYVRLRLEKDSMGFIAKKLKVALNLLAGDDPIKVVFEKEDLESGIHDIIQSGLDHNKVQKKESVENSITYYF